VFASHIDATPRATIFGALAVILLVNIESKKPRGASFGQDSQHTSWLLAVLAF
jgi:hypothetical protein